MVAYSIRITPSVDGDYVASGSVYDHDPYAGGEETTALEYDVSDVLIRVEQVDALRSGLRNLVPIGNMFTDQPCWHIFPDWDVTLVFEDDTRITLVTNESNVLSVGGPWMTTIDGQAYMQVDASFLIALADVTYDTLDLPWGHFMSYGCGSPQSVLDAGFR